MKLLANSLLIFLLVLSPSICFAQASCLLHESDSDGDGWGWEDNTSCLITEDTGKVPILYHPRTKQKIELERLTWSWSDFSGKSIQDCEGFVVDPEQEEDLCSTCKEGDTATHIHESNGNGTTHFNQEGGESSEATFTWNVDHNGVYSGVLPIKIYGEKTTSGVRFWLKAEANQTGFYTLCKIPSNEKDDAINNPKLGKAVSQNSPKPCIDTDGDGWGWDGSKSCKIPSSSK